jgi:hypothetical protein
MRLHRIASAILLSAWACGNGGGGQNDGGVTNDGATSDVTTPSDASTNDSGGPAPIAGLRLFFSDLESGPDSGGENGKGAYVTIWGNGFGDSRGTSTVTIGGGAADNYPVWSSTKITFQLGAAAASGDVVVHVANKGDSNALPFTVRAGNIFFVTSTGSDQADGSFATPWKTIPKAKNAQQAGDIAYIGTHAGDSVSQTTVDASSSYNCALGMSFNDGSNSGTQAMPKALVAYPGATATIGVENGIEHGILSPGITGTFDYWVFSQLVLRGQNEAIDIENSGTGWRIIGNDISCPNGTGESGCVTGGQNDNTAGLKMFGNVVHDAAKNVTTITKYYHAVYWGSDHIEMGWNVVENGKTCRAIQFHDTGGNNEFDLSVHDNLIHDTVCDGINFATVDPSQGAVVAYDNVIYNVGLGPDPADGAANYAGIYVANETEAGSPGSGAVMLYNNTLYDCGARANSDSGAIGYASGPVTIQMNDNVIVATGSDAYFGGDKTSIAGSNDLLFGAGAAPQFLTATVASDPMFVAATTFDFHLQSGSPAIDMGIATPAATDYDGNVRPQGSAYDIGAYEYVK